MLYSFSDFEFDTNRCVLTRSGRPLDVDFKALGVLQLLIEHRGEVVERDEILKVVWPGVAVGQNSISQALYVLRRALGDDTQAPRFIQTIRGRGVRFVGVLRRNRRRFEGRRAEIEEVASAVDRARMANGSVTVFVGPAGIGKSALLDRVCAGAPSDVVVLRASCDEEEGSPPLWAWSQILRAALPFASSQATAAMLTESPEIAPLVGFDGPARALDSDPVTRRIARREAIARYLRRVAASGPVLIAMDDIHRADEWSLQLLRFLSQVVPSLGIVVIATSRPVGPNGPSCGRHIERLLLDPRVERRELSGLDRDEIHRLIASLAPSLATVERATLLRELTAGNPFLLLQMMEQPRLGEGGLGREARAGVLRHARELPGPVLESLEDAAILGRRFAVRDVAQISNASPEIVTRRLRVAEEAGLVRSGSPEWCFEHIVIRDVLAGEVESSRLADRHVRAAALLRERAASTANGPRIATHLLQAARHETSIVDEAIRETVASARACIELLAFEDARRVCEQATQWVDVSTLDADLAFELRLALGESQLRSGNRADGRDSILEAWRLARDSGMATRVAEAALALTPGFFALETGVVDPVTVTLLEESTKLELGNSQLEADLRHRLAVALVWGGSISERRELIEDATTRAEGAQDDLLADRLEASRLVALWSASNATERVDRSAALATRASDPEIELMARVFHASALHEVGRCEEARKEASRFSALARHYGVRQALWYGDVLSGMFALDEGDLSSVEEVSRSIDAFGALNEDANIEHSVALFGAALAWWRGDLEPWLGAIDGIVKRYPAVEAWRVARALALSDAGRTEEAEVEIRVLLRDGSFSPGPLEVAGLTVLCHACCEVGVAAEGERLYSRLEQFRGHMAVGGYGVFTWGAVEGGLGKLALALGDLDRAERDLTAAIETLERARATAWLADAACTLAHCLIRRGRSRDMRRASSLKSRAREVAAARRLTRVVVALDALETQG